MNCPNCKTIKLEPQLSQKGVEVDICPTCKGLWLDKGEIFYFTEDTDTVQEALNRSYQKKSKSELLSPIENKPMVSIPYTNDLKMFYCEESGGVWLEKESLDLINSNIDELQIVTNHIKKKELPKTPILNPLPNLYVRSFATIFGLYFILGIVAITLIEFFNFDATLTVGFAIIFSIIQFLLGPFFMGITLRWLYSMSWVEKEDLPLHLKDFVQKVCDENNIPFPKFGIINDGSPQAFTYGRTPKSAYIVISKGTMELLTPEELEAVVAHEMGHVIHWDMFLMTIVQLVPLVLYYIYRTLMNSSENRSSSKNSGGTVAIAIGAYILYILSEYAVLWFSRTREFYADRFSGNATKDPSYLASALVKIAYGLASRDENKDNDNKDNKNKEKKSKLNMSSIKTMGIFDGGAARSLAVTSYRGNTSSEKLNKEHIKGAMRWDLWNPWAMWYEIHSTHPLVAKRLEHLSNQSIFLEKEPFVIFDEEKPESYWDEFLVDVTIDSAPWLFFITAMACIPAYKFLFPEAKGLFLFIIPILISLIGVAMLIRHFFVYPDKDHPEMCISSLLKFVKVSGIRAVPCKVTGEIIGKGIPGYIFSDDFILRDKSGIIFIDYKQPLALLEFLFGLLKSKKYTGKEVEIEGWYHRCPAPYIKIKNIKSLDGELKDKSWSPALNLFFSIAMIALGGAALIVLPGILN